MEKLHGVTLIVIQYFTLSIYRVPTFKVEFILCISDKKLLAKNLFWLYVTFMHNLCTFFFSIGFVHENSIIIKVLFFLQKLSSKAFFRYRCSIQQNV